MSKPVSGRKPFTVLLSDKERAALQKLARRQGCKSAVYLRILLRDKAYETGDLNMDALDE